MIMYTAARAATGTNVDTRLDAELDVVVDVPDPAVEEGCEILKLATAYSPSNYMKGR